MNYLKQKREELIDVKNTVTSSWTYNHKHLIITFSIAVALVWQSQVIQPHLPAFSLTKVTYAENPLKAISTPLEKCDYECLTRQWVELRTAEILEEKAEENYKRARFDALIEANELITKI